jgi:hypothetical protein
MDGITMEEAMAKISQANFGIVSIDESGKGYSYEINKDTFRIYWSKHGYQDFKISKDLGWIEAMVDMIRNSQQAQKQTTNEAI